MTAPWPSNGKTIAQVGPRLWRLYYVSKRRVWRVKELVDNGGKYFRGDPVKEYTTKKAALAWIERRRSICESVA